jgi:hypothetical protein
MAARTIYRLVFCAAMSLAHWLPPAPAQAQPATSARASAVKAAFLYNFAGFVEWPPGTFQRPDQPLVIGVAGDDEVAADLEQLTAGRTVGERPLAVRRLAEGAPATGVQIYFVGRRRESQLRDAVEGAAGPVLVVTDQPGALRLGSVINFVSEGGRLRFAASLAAAEARNLKLSARLLAVAQDVEGRTR